MIRKTRPGDPDDRAAWARMRLLLFEDLDPAFNAADMAAFEERHEQQVFLAMGPEGPAGFAEVALRNLVDGCLTTPVGYLEAIYVDLTARGHGHARGLLKAAMDWARDQGCTEFATDSALEDVEAQQFHRAMGFEETFRIVQFRLEL